MKEWEQHLPLERHTPAKIPQLEFHHEETQAVNRIAGWHSSTVSKTWLTRAQELSHMKETKETW